MPLLYGSCLEFGSNMHTHWRPLASPLSHAPRDPSPLRLASPFYLLPLLAYLGWQKKKKKLENLKLYNLLSTKLATRRPIDRQSNPTGNLAISFNPLACGPGFRTWSTLLAAVSCIFVSAAINFSHFDLATLNVKCLMGPASWPNWADLSKQQK